MARTIISQARFSGISYSSKEGPRSSFVFSKCADFRTDPTKLKILPRTLKSSGNTVLDLIMDGDRQSTDSYFYGDAGHIYKKTSAESWSDLRVVPDSHGNGMKYFGEDSYLYYTSDTVIGRYGPFWGTASFTDDFLGAEGGIPTNLRSLDLELATSEYATAADSATLSIASDISIECSVKHESIPTTAGTSMVFASKWNGSGNQRSYFFELYCLSGYFGDGTDGALTISTNTTEAPIDSACTGTAAAFSLSATNASFAAGQKILIHQSRGTGAGKWERNQIVSYTAGTITLSNKLANTYVSGAQVRVLKQYTNVTVNSGITWTAKAWNGTVGGILAFLANGTVTVTGTITASNKGFRGGASVTGSDQYGRQGEGQLAAGGTQSILRNGAGGGGGGRGSGQPPGAGGGYGTAGGGASGGGTYSEGGNAWGTTDLTTMGFGGGGGSGGTAGDASANSGAGGIGGGVIFIIGTTIATITGLITSNGQAGFPKNYEASGAGGGGAGGSVLIKAQTATLGTNKITATGGVGGFEAGAGGVGRIHLDYYTSYTGTTNPTLNATQDNTLVTTLSYQLRFGVSTNGTTPEYLTKTLATSPTLAQWYHYAMTWDASEKLVTFYLDGTSLGTATGALTAIKDSTALLAIGAKFSDAGAAESFLDGKIDSIRVWNDIRSASEIYSYRELQLVGTEANLKACWQFDAATEEDDLTANNNDLTLVVVTDYSTDVPFAARTTRRDLDQSLDTSGQAYTLPTSIDEGATHRQSFVPAKDPQKSIAVLVADKGTGAWTLTVHDGLNREIATKTITNANMVASDDNEFVFATPWRPVVGATYHFHLTVSTGTSTVTTTTTVDLETVDFHTYYQFLVESNFHPQEQILNKLAIGNERYLAIWDAITYNPHTLTLPSGYTIRCLGKWREYLVIGTILGSAISDYDQGYLFFWDGISTTYNFGYPIPEGGINTILSGDPLYFVAGYTGDLMTYNGGQPQKKLRMPKVEGSVTLEINPKALAMWRALVHIGMAENSTSTTIERGVYSYGTLNESLSPTLSFDYPLSLGVTTGADLEIGMLMPIGSSLYISWRNGSSYGVDYVSLSNAPFATASCEFLISDMNKVWAEKQAHVIRGLFKSLADGDSIKLKYKIDRQSSWVEGDLEDTEGAKESRLPLPTKANRFDEFQVAVEMNTTNTTSPTFLGWGAEVEDLQRERRT